MQFHTQKNAPAQKKEASTAASVLDSSSQSESLRRKADMANNAAQRAEAPRPNNTGMPDNLKSGIESLSGFSMDDVRVHYNSSKPATVQALAYTQGTDIHVAPGQEKHLPHEAWHVAQQMAGRVSPTTNINGMPVNDNAGLEHEADVMGEKATTITQRMKNSCQTKQCNILDCIQMVISVVGTEDFQANHLVTDAEYTKDLDLMTVSTRAPFANISLQNIKSLNEADYQDPLYQTWIRWLKKDTKGCQESKKGTGNNAKIIIKQSLNRIQTDANNKTISHQRAKSRGQFNSITKSSSLEASSTKIKHPVYGEEYKISNVSAISCNSAKGSTPYSSHVNAYYTLKKSGDNETRTFVHIDNE